VVKDGWAAISGVLQGGRADFSPQLASLKQWRKISPSAGSGIITRKGMDSRFRGNDERKAEVTDTKREVHIAGCKR
jgi:hypothetical protein